MTATSWMFIVVNTIALLVMGGKLMLYLGARGKEFESLDRYVRNHLTHKLDAIRNSLKEQNGRLDDVEKDLIRIDGRVGRLEGEK